MTTPAAAGALWPLVSKRPLPRIHVLSDVHLETGPYEIPAELKFDILVAAGDIGPVEIAVPWLASLNKPVVYVLGNHERWGRRWDEAVDVARTAAKGTQVHVLERNEVLLQGVRFLGATLWTSYGDWNAHLVEQALQHMNDHRSIDASSWYATGSNVRWLRSHLRRVRFRVPGADECRGLKRFHPVIAYQTYLRTRRWLVKRLQRKHDGPTVIVTHHAPTFASLRAAGISDELLNSENWNRRDEMLVRVACYASPMRFRGNGPFSDVDFWVHGHLHAGLDVLDDGVRIVCNPRGRCLQPLTEDDVGRYALFGFHLTRRDVAASQERSRENPYRGDAQGFDASLVIDFEDGYARPLTRMIQPQLRELRLLVERAKETLPALTKRSREARWARRCFDADARAFHDRAQHLMQQFERSVWGRSFRWRLPRPPVAPVERLHPGGIPREMFMLCVENMESWRVIAATVPTLASRFLRAWAAAAVRIIDAARLEHGCQAWVIRLPARSLRALDSTHISLVVERAFANEQEMYVWAGSKTQHGKDTRDSMQIGTVTAVDECGPGVKDSLLSRDALQRFLDFDERGSDYLRLAFPERMAADEE